MFNRLFGRQPIPPEEPPVDYEVLFDQIMNGLAAGWSADQVKACLAGREDDQKFVEWLYRYGKREQIEPSVAKRLLQWGEMECGRIGKMAQYFGEQPLKISTSVSMPSDAQVMSAKQASQSNPQELKAQALIELSIQQFNTQDYQGMIASIDKATQIAPEYYPAWKRLGNVMLLSQHNKQAISAFESALAIKPDCHTALSGKGEALYNLSSHGEAISALDAALAIKADDDKSLFLKGLSLIHLGLYEEAFQVFDTVIEIKPDSYGAFFNKGYSLWFLTRCEEAIAAFDQALAIKPDFHEAWFNRGKSSGDVLHQTSSFLAFLSPSHLPLRHPELQKRGYLGELACYEVGLQYVQKETNPLGWGLLLQATGRAHYYHDRNKPTQLYKALAEYDQALTTLTAADYPTEHLETLQLCIRAHLGLNNTDQVRTLRQQALTVFQDLINQATTDTQRRRIETQFSGLSHLKVDLLLAEGLTTEALLAAERYKNRVLTWILDHWQEQTISPSLDQIRTLLTPQTAIIYWHLSDDILTTFVITDSAPITATTRPSQPLETWLQKWSRNYNEYRTKGKAPSDPLAEGRETHLWRTELKNQLKKLKKILNINELIPKLPNLKNLILIPHRDLHRLPLHALLPEKLITTYLPSAQVGLSISSAPSINTNPLLIEPPIHKGLEPLTAAELETSLIAQLCKTYGQSPELIPQAHTNKAELITNLHQPHRCLHFSGHAAYEQSQPENSALYLTGDDLLTAKDIAALNLQDYDLVTLSACETAITGTNTITTEYVGLVSAFLKAGAAQVLSTLWTVESRSSTWLMLHFYDAYLTSTPAPIALRKAQQWLRSSTSDQIIDRLQAFLTDELIQQQPLVTDELKKQIKKLQRTLGTMEKPYADPYYWAPYTLTGYPTVSDSSRSPC